MSLVTLTGRGTVTSADFKYVKWVGKSKSGKAVTIILPEAMCISNIDWALADKDEIVPEVEFEGVYNDANLAAGTITEPWSLTYDGSIASGNDEIVLAAGVFYAGASEQTAALVGLTRGGGSFKVDRTYREQKADGDPGKVKDRVTQDEGRPKLSLKALQWLTKASTLYSGLNSTNGTAITLTLTNLTATGDTSSTAGKGVYVKLAANTGYTLPAAAAVAITISGAALGLGAFTYNASTGVIEIPGYNVTGAVVITAAGVS